MKETLIAYLKKAAARKTVSEEDADPFDSAGVNSKTDEAYTRGYDDGETYLARDVIAQLGLK